MGDGSRQCAQIIVPDDDGSVDGCVMAPATWDPTAWDPFGVIPLGVTGGAWGAPGAAGMGPDTILCDAE